jgi:hypothetical protein
VILTPPAGVLYGRVLITKHFPKLCRYYDIFPIICSNAHHNMYYYYLTACRWVAARAPYSFLALLATYLAALFCMVRLTDPYVTPTAPIPDLLFGFTPVQLQTIFRTAWGPAGCRAYGLAGCIEMCPYLPAYGLFTGGGLVRAAQRQGWRSDRPSWSIDHARGCDGNDPVANGGPDYTTSANINQ